MVDSERNLSLLFYPDFPKEPFCLKDRVTQYLGIPPPRILPPKEFTSPDDLGVQLLHDISRFELLTAEQEATIADMLNEARTQTTSIFEYYNYDLSLLSSDDTAAEQLNYYTNLSEVLEHILVERNTRLIIPFIKKHINSRRSLENLFSAGVLGLYRAAQKYSGETRFSTYAANWIRSKAQFEMQTSDNSVKIAATTITEIVRLKKKAENGFIQKHGRYPTYKELEQAVVSLYVRSDSRGNIKITEDYINKKRKWVRVLLSRVSMNEESVSLDEHISGEDSDYRSRYDLNPDPSAEVDPMIESADLNRAIQEAEEFLDGREVAILRMKYGLFDADLGREYTDGEIAALWSRMDEKGITRQRINQIHKGAIEKLQRPDRALKLKEYLQFVRDNTPPPTKKRKV